MSRVAAFFLAIAATLGAAVADTPLRYDLKAIIEPAAGTVAVRGYIQIPWTGSVPRVSFNLHKTFAVAKLAVDGKPADFTYREIEPTPFNPATREVIVTLPAGTGQGGMLRLDIAYSGRLEQIPEWGSAPGQTWAMDDQVNARMVQLASYSSWYPQFASLGQLFQSDLEVSLPQGWTAVSGGAKTDMGVSVGRAVTRWNVPKNFDIVVVASPQFRQTAGRTSAAAIEVYDTQMPGEVVTREVKDLAAVMTLFESELGETSIPGGTVRHVYSPLKHGQGRAGIARPGLIVTSQGRVLDAMAANPDYTLFQDIAHEIAHFWWYSGTGQGDWINEAFAEYHSALAVEKLVSRAEFENVLAKYRLRVSELPAGTPSLAAVPGQGGSFVLRYYKGSLMLDDFRRILGDEAFFQAARAFYQTYRNGSVGTAEFRAFWGARLGRARVDSWIDSTGSVLPLTSADARAGQ